MSTVRPCSTIRRILFLTATRADFGKLKPLMQIVEEAPDFECQIFATGMHTMAHYGFTVDEIRSAGFANIFPFISHVDVADGRMDVALANTIHGFSQYVRETSPDLIVVHGDRIDPLAGAIVGQLNGVLVAHVEGGERSGAVDEALRHSISKLSQIHFVANDEARCRLIQMGEPPEAIWLIGSPDIDVMLSPRLPTLDEVRQRYGIPFDDYGVLLYHPVTTESDLLSEHADAVVSAVEMSGWNFVIIYPNNDRGSNVLLQSLDRLRGRHNCVLLPSMRFEHFLSLMKSAKAVVGNSSAGIREAPVYGVPSVNIGTRQLDRFHYGSIINVPEDRIAILTALMSLPAHSEPSLYFGVGTSAVLFLAALREQRLWTISKQKRFRDLKVTDSR